MDYTAGEGRCGSQAGREAGGRSADRQNPEVPVVRHTIAALCRSATRFYESATALRGSPGAQPALACGPGCAACCHLPVMVSPAEVAQIVEYVQAHWNEAEVAALRDRCRTYRHAVTNGEGRLNYLARVPCPLLDGEQRCSVYEVRPLHCRGWNSTDRSACEAERRAPEGVHEIPQLRGPVERAAEVGEGLSRALRRAGMEGGEVRLAFALEKALSKADGVAGWYGGAWRFSAARGEGR